jgi:DNA-binding CsgD family transcriptional regulator/RecA/RadA recombinase
MMLERDRELQALLAAFGSVDQTGGRVVLVCGEAGIGKTSLIVRLVEQVQGEHTVALGLCDPLDTPRPLGPVRDITWKLLGPPTGEARDEVRCFEGLMAALARAGCPVLLVIEDLHWVDERTLDWLKFLGRRIAQVPVLLVCSYRDDELEAGHPVRTALGLIPAARTTWLALKPLSLDAVRLIAQGSASSPEDMHAVTGGNPFLLTELLSGSYDERVVPRSVAEAINARLNALPPEAVTLLEMIACWPGPVPFSVIERLPDMGFSSMIPLALRRRFLVERDGRVGFRHELARRAVLDRMEPEPRANACARFLAALTAGPDHGAELEVLVHLALGADDADALLRYAPQAAARAAALGAHREAARYLSHALQRSEGLPAARSAELHESWAYEAGLALAIDVDVIAARRRAVELWQEVGRPDRVGENLWWLSRMHWYRGEAEAAQRYVAEAIALLEREAPSSTKAKALALRAQFFMLQDRMEDAVEWGRQALAMAEAVGDDEVRVHALNTVGSALLFRGKWEGEALLRDSLALALRLDLHEQAARVYTNLSECLIELRALDRAEALIEEGVVFDATHDLDAWTFYLVGRKAQLRLEQDACEEAIAFARDVLGRANQTLLMKMPAMIVLARALMRRCPQEAAQVLAQAREAAEKIAEPQYLAAVAIADLELAALTGDTSVARRSAQWLGQVDRALLSPRKCGEALLWSQLSGVGGLGHLAEGAALPAPFALFEKGAFEEALAAFLAEHSTYLGAWALVAAHDAALLGQADALFQDIGALAARKYLRARWPDAGLPRLQRGPYRAARGHPLGLTGKEQQVMRLMVEGLSNAAIAEAIGRSRRTVENHVSSILSKTQAASRIDVVLRVQSEPWLLQPPG